MAAAAAAAATAADILKLLFWRDFDSWVRSSTCGCDVRGLQFVFFSPRIELGAGVCV